MLCPRAGDLAYEKSPGPPLKKLSHMKIALLRQRVTALGGAETTLGYLVRGMIAAGHQVAVYGVERESEARAALGPGVAYVQVPVWGGKTLRLLSFARNARRLLKEASPQLGFSLERVPGIQVYRAGDGCHRRSRPKFFNVTLTPGAACRRLYSAR